MVTEKYQLKFPSKPENISLVESFLDNTCDELGIGDELYGNILISVTEAVNNAIKHGNQNEQSKVVALHMDQSNNHITFIIKDQGSGFDYTNLPDPTAPENIEKPTGRGIFLMRQLADKVSFEDEGSTVKISFDLNPSS